MPLLTEEEKGEIVSGVINGFKEAAHIHKQFRDFAQGVMFRAVAPSTIFRDLLLTLMSEAEITRLSVEKLLEKLDDPRFAKQFNQQWHVRTSQMRVEGSLMASITAMCVERFLQNGRYFRKGDRSNDLKRLSDGSRWEVKGAREKAFTLTINQSHQDIENTYFLVYNGKPENRTIHGIYVLKGEERLFSPRRAGLNMRTFQKQFFDTHVRLILPETRLED